MPSKSGSVQLDARLIAIIVSVAVVPTAIKLIYYPHNIGSDDAYIHLRVATEFVRGLGWGINPHEPVNLSTAPAFTLLLSVVERLSGHVIGSMQALSCGAVAMALLAIFAVAHAETRSVAAALLAETSASFSLNLWRWTGTLMETTFAFAVVACVLYLLRTGRRQSMFRSAVLGGILGSGMLLRPEMGLLAVLAGVVLVLRSEPKERLRHFAWMSVCVAIPLAGWVWFAHTEGISVMPTTYAAKSVAGILWINVDFVKEFLESVVESLFLPTALVLVVACIGLRKRRDPEHNAVSYIVPVGWIAGLFVFYYLKMPGLPSAGRYLLPLLPCEALILALVWRRFSVDTRNWQRRLVAGALGLHALFAIGLNQWMIAPVLRRFENEYGAAMRATAEELTRKTAGLKNRRVLVYADIGVLSCAADGSFEIYDGGALATPSLRGLDLKAQIETVQPAFVVESLSMTPEGSEAGMPATQHPVWERRYLQHGLRFRNPYFYAIIFSERSP